MLYSRVLALFLCVNLVIAQNATFDSDVVMQTKKECKTLRRKYLVKPGVSWGEMNEEQQKLWMAMRCDQFFCKPDRMEGRGVYKCIPIANT